MTGQGSAPRSRLVRVSGFELAYLPDDPAAEAELRRRYSVLFADESTRRRGGLGSVCLVTNAYGEKLALKELLPQGASDAGQTPVVPEARLAAFRAEYDAQRSLAGLPCVPALCGWGMVEGLPVILMEWVGGVTLDRARAELAVDDEAASRPRSRSPSVATSSPRWRTSPRPPRPWSTGTSRPPTSWCARTAEALPGRLRMVSLTCASLTSARPWLPCARPRAARARSPGPARSCAGPRPTTRRPRCSPTTSQAWRSFAARRPSMSTPPQAWSMTLPAGVRPLEGWTTPSVWAPRRTAPRWTLRPRLSSWRTPSLAAWTPSSRASPSWRRPSPWPSRTFPRLPPQATAPVRSRR